MTDFLIFLFDKNPWLLYVLLGFIFILLILLAFGIFQGREVSIYPPKIGPKIKKSVRSNKSPYRASSTQSQQQTQNVNIGLTQAPF